MLWLLACNPDPTGSTSTHPDPVPGGPPTLRGPEDERIGLVRILEAELHEPGPVTLVVEGGGERWEIESPAATSHRIPILGLLPDTSYLVTADLGSREDELTFRTESIPERPFWPTIDVLAHDPDRVEPGWTLLPVNPQGSPGGVVLILDEQLRMRWWMLSDDIKFYNALPDGAGGLWLAENTAVRRITLDGTVLVQDDDPAYDNFHELYPDGDGGWWVFRDETVVQQAPTWYGVTTTREDEVQDNVLVHRGPDGAERSAWSMAALLDPTRCGFEGLNPLDDGLDFVHANAAIPLDDGGAIVSLRNQDAVMRLDDQGQIRWILGDPLGWSEPWQDKLLEPTPGTTWHYHAHGPQWFEDEQLLLLFDNRFFDHTPYGPEPGTPKTSRVVGYRVDEAAGTVTQVLELDQTATGPTFAPVLGETDRLPVTGNLFAVYGWVNGEGGVPNVDLGRGDVSTRVVEMDPDQPDEVALDLSLWVPYEQVPAGIWIYRAERGLPPLHP